MKARHPVTETYKSRSNRIEFMDAVDRMAREKHGSSWTKPTADGGPMRLPETREEATQTQLYYAVAVLKHVYPSLEFKEVFDFNDSVPSYARRDYPDLDISDDLWREARDDAEWMYDTEIGRHSMLDDVLDDFANKACKGRIKCFLHDEHTRIEKPMEVGFWEVNEVALRSRYWSSSIELPHGKTRLRYLILVDEDSLSDLQPSTTLDVAERRNIVCGNLIKAKDFNPDIPPYGKISNLRKEIAEYLGCSLKEAGELVYRVTEGCWSKQGISTNSAKERKNPTEIVPKQR